MSQNPPQILEKCAKNHRKSRFRGVRGVLGRGLGAMVAPRGAQEPKNIQKPRSRSTLGPPCGSPFSALFAIVRCFFVDFFPDIFVMDFLSISDLPGPQKQWFCLSKTILFRKTPKSPRELFWYQFASILGGLGTPKSEKLRSRIDA